MQGVAKKIESAMLIHHGNLCYNFGCQGRFSGKSNSWKKSGTVDLVLLNNFSTPSESPSS